MGVWVGASSGNAVAAAAVAVAHEMNSHTTTGKTPPVRRIDDIGMFWVVPGTDQLTKYSQVPDKRRDGREIEGQTQGGHE